MYLKSVISEEEVLPKRGGDLSKVTQLGAFQGTLLEFPQRKGRRNQGWALPSRLPPMPVCPQGPLGPHPNIAFSLGVDAQQRIHLIGKGFFPRELSIHSPPLSSLPKDPPVTPLSKRQLAGNKE